MVEPSSSFGPGVTMRGIACPSACSRCQRLISVRSLPMSRTLVIPFITSSGNSVAPTCDRWTCVSQNPGTTPRFLVDRGAGRDCIAATRYRELADAVEAMAVGDTDEERRARWLVWLRAYVTRVEQEVVRELPDPERGPKPHWSY